MRRSVMQASLQFFLTSFVSELLWCNPKKNTRCPVRLTQPRQCVLRPDLIVILREVLASKGFARLFTSLSSKQLQHCLVDEVFQLKGLIQVGTPVHATILDQSFVPDSSINIATH